MKLVMRYGDQILLGLCATGLIANVMFSLGVRDLVNSLVSDCSDLLRAF